MNIIQNKVKSLVKKHKTNNPFELANELDIIVLKSQFDLSIKGFYQYFQRNKIIYINSILSSNEQNIVCSHELGHAILHTKLNIMFLENNTFCIKDRFEIEANKFAAELLIPDDLLYKYPNYTIEQIVSTEHIPIELLKLKFNI